MAHSRLSANITFHLLFHCSIRAGRTLMLTQMFRPGIYQENFQVAIGILEIAKDSPLVSSVTTSNGSVFVYCRDKARDPFRVDGVLDGYKDRSGVRGRRILIQYGGQAPMNPGREIDGCVGQLQE